MKCEIMLNTNALLIVPVILGLIYIVYSPEIYDLNHTHKNNVNFSQFSKTKLWLHYVRNAYSHD